MVDARAVWQEIDEIARNEKVTLAHHRTLISLGQYDIAYSLAQEFLRPNAKVLDWGVGNGHFGLFLVKCGYNAHGFSIFEKPIYRAFIDRVNARHHDAFKYVLGEPELNRTSIPYPDATFDAVFSIGVLEHVREFGGSELGSLEEIHRILRPNGLMICTAFPNRWSYVELIRHGHKYKYGLSQIWELAQQSGFEVVRAGRYQFLPRVMVNKLPDWLANSGAFAFLYSLADKALAFAFNVICTNNYFVFRKT